MTDIAKLIEKLSWILGQGFDSYVSGLCGEAASALSAQQERIDELLVARAQAMHSLTAERERVDEIIERLGRTNEAQRERIEALERERDEWREQAHRDSALAVCNEKQAATIATFKQEIEILESKYDNLFHRLSDVLKAADDGRRCAAPRQSRRRRVRDRKLKKTCSQCGYRED